MSDPSPSRNRLVSDLSEAPPSEYVEGSATFVDRLYFKQYQKLVGGMYHENKPVPDVTVPWLYESHSISVVGILLVGMVFVALSGEPASMQDLLLYRAAPLCVFFFLVLGAFIFPNGPFIRPHPILWRCAFGVSLLYLLFLVGMSVLSPQQMRDVLHYFDGSTGVCSALPLYAEDCSLTWKNLAPKLDMFVPAHFFGWAAKGLMFRHRVFLWLFSIAWEMVELSLVFVVPNFGECWWDSWILDVLLCNGLGIELGLFLCRYLEFQRYSWTGVYHLPTLWQKVERVALQFTPESWPKLEWESFSTVKRFLQVQFLFLMVLVIDLNVFLLKLHLCIPSEHWWLLARTLFLALIACACVRQWYLYVIDPNITRLGTQMIVFILIAFTELLIIYKVSPPLPEIPASNKLAWAVWTALYIGGSAFMLMRMRRKAKNKVQ